MYKVSSTSKGNIDNKVSFISFSCMYISMFVKNRKEVYLNIKACKINN